MIPVAISTVCAPPGDATWSMAALVVKYVSLYYNSYIVFLELNIHFFRTTV